MSVSTTPDAVRRMLSMSTHGDDPGFEPVLQVINIRSVGNNGSERFRAVLSDGTHYVQGMLASQLNPLVHKKVLKTDCVVRINEFMKNEVQNRSVIIVIRLTHLYDHEQGRIGSPENIEKTGYVNSAGGVPDGGAQPLYNSTNAGVGGGGGAGAVGGRPMPYGGHGSSVVKPTGGAGVNPYGSVRSSSNPYGGNQPIVRSAVPQVTTSGGGPTTTDTGAPITPISQLNMYQNRWTILARVTDKSNIRTWSNAKGEGSLFSVDLLDNSGTDIRATFFRDAVDRFYNFLEIGKVFTLSGGRLKVANMKFNTCKSQYEVTFDANADIRLSNDVGNIQKQVYDFVKISEIENVEANSYVDLLAVVKSVAEPAHLISKKTGQELVKCDLLLVDDSNVEINLTVWGEAATQAPTTYANTPVAAFRRARVSDYGGKTLSASGAVDVNPSPQDVPQVQQLRSWLQSTNGGANVQARSLSTSMGGGGKMDRLQDRKDIAAIKAENLGYTNPDKPDWLSFKATICFLKNDRDGGAWYPACPNAGEPCQNRYKVTQTTDGQWMCDKCGGSYPDCVRRWIFSGVIEDDTSSTWVSFFNEHAEKLFDGATAQDIYRQTYVESDGSSNDQYESVFARANHTEWIMKCKVKNEMVQDESRVKTSVYSLHPVDYVQESRDLLDAIAKF